MKEIVETQRHITVRDLVGDKAAIFVRWAVENFGTDFVTMIPEEKKEGEPQLIGFGLSPEFVDGLNDAYSVERRNPSIEAGAGLLRAMLGSPWILGQVSGFAPIFEHGLKIFEPDSECCEALANTRPLIPFDDYEQPFPSMIIKLPVAFRRKHTADVALPEFLAIRRRQFEDGGSSIHFMGLTPGVGDIVSSFVSSGNGYRTIEDALIHVRKGVSRENGQVLEELNPGLELGDVEGYSARDWDANTLIQRVAINACLLLTQYGYTTRPALTKGQLRKLRRKVSRKGSQSTREHLATMTDYVDINQEIEWSRAEPRDSDSDSGDGTGRRLRFHWRKGHFKMQRHGKGLTKRKRVFIKPYPVNKGDYRGPPEEARSVYR